MKRYFLVQKAKDAGTVGLVVGTLGSADYRAVTDRLQVMLRACGKKDYTLLVGKVNPAKLANFDEIDVYCLVACPEHSLVSICREQCVGVGVETNRQSSGQRSGQKRETWLWFFCHCHTHTHARTHTHTHTCAHRLAHV